MTVAYSAIGGPTYASGATINHTPTYPAFSAGDMLILFVGVKPNTSTVNTPTGFTSLGSFTGGSGATGIDTGPMQVQAFYREAQAGDTAQNINITSTNVCFAAVLVATKGAGNTWATPAAAGGADSTTGTAFSVTCGSDPGLTAGDLVLTCGVIPTDVGAGAQFTAEAVSATGVSAWSAFTELAEPNTNVGQDIGGFIFHGSVTTGTSSAAPVITATASGTTTNVAGPAMLVRLREVVASVNPPAPRIVGNSAAIQRASNW